MTTNTDPVRALAELVDAAALMLCEIDTCGHPVDPAYRATLHDAWTKGQAAIASAPPSAPEPEVHSYDPTEHRESVTIRWPDGKCLGYVLDRTRYTDNLPPSAPAGVEDGPIDASDNAEYIEHCADRLERCGLRVTAGALRVIAHEHRALSQQPAPPSAPVGVKRWPFVESPGEFTERLAAAMQELPLIGAVRHVLIENPPALSQQPAAPEGCGACGDGCANRSGGCRLAEENPPAQPAAPSGEAVGAWVTVPRIPTDAMLDAMHGRIRILCNPAERTADIQNDVEVWGAMLAAAPQQPAGVDEAMVERAVAAVMSAPAGISVEAYVRIVLEAALAAQQPAGVDGMVMVQASDLKTLAEFADRGMRGNPAKLAALRAKAILADNRQEGE